MNSTENSTNTTNSTYEPYPDQALDYFDHRIIFRVYLEIYTILSIICIAADVLITFVIVKHQRLRNNKRNVIIMHWAITNIFLMIFSPLIYRFSVDVFLLDATSYFAYCMIEHLEFASFLANLLLMLLLTFHWYMELYNPNTFEKFNRTIYFYVIICYVICFTFLAFSLHTCISYFYWGLNEFMLFVVCVIYGIIMLTLNVVHCFKKRNRQSVNKTNVSFILTNIYFLTFLSVFIFVFFAVVEVSYTAFAIIFCTLMLFIMSSPLYFFFVLYKFDRDFNVFFRHVFSCRCKDYQGDEFRDQPVIYSNHADDRTNNVI